MQEEFNEKIAAFKAKSLQEKKSLFIREIKETIAVYVMLANTYNIPVNFVKSREVADIENGKGSEDDYFEALYVYLNVLKEVTSAILDVKTDAMES